MGRGNVCVFGEHEGLYYIDNGDFYVYRRGEDFDSEVKYLRDLDMDDLSSEEWHKDEWFTENEEEDILYNFAHDFSNEFPSFEDPHKKWIDRNSKRVILESKLFYIVVEDNEWSIAIELIQKDDESWMSPFQKRLSPKYLRGIAKCLLNRLPSIGTYTGAWTSGKMTREDLVSE